ncbi:hydratase [Pleomorphomonas carboxyditropha]|uniref:Hydratase n=1 Tax=Pleomorphomonas carboxyditropha TaxID=2023338 RepID=A0A2G9WSJ6_9HYPH|nr:hydratase [Pleomorphomonas carboxyditropha]PIO97110.1 hydratase [Pleomorphomonas carboxyditropha]
MLDDNLRRLACLISENRRTGTVSDLPFDALRTEQDACSVQSAATSAFAEDALGYAIVGGSAAIRRSLGIEAPIYGAIPVGTCQGESDRPIRLPPGMIGAQCDLVFTMGAPLGADRGPVNREGFCAAVLSCRPAIGLVGRRGHLSGRPHLAAIADFALHVATCVGSHHEAIDPAVFDGMSLRASINGNDVLHAEAGGRLVDPVASAVWLVNELIGRDLHLRAGDIVAAGALAPILLQILPGQELAVEISGIGGIAARFA